MSWNKILAALGVIALVCFSLNILLGGPKLPISAANGRYFNPCCGTISLKDGQMSVNDRTLGYEIERSKTGGSVLPKFYVGASETGFVIDPSLKPLYIDLDATAHPHRLRLMDVASGTSHWFNRQAERQSRAPG
jgi:hypothetical protein